MSADTKTKILTLSDTLAGLTAVVQNWATGASYGGPGMVMPMMQATVISATSRAMSSYLTGTKLPMSDTVLSGDVSNLLLVALTNAMLAYLMKRNPLKSAFVGAEIDSLAYTIMKNLPATVYSGGDPVLIQI